MSDGSELLKLLFKKERISEERVSEEQRERFALGIKKGENCQKRTININFLSKSLTWLFYKELRERFPHVDFIAHGRFLK